MPTTQPDGTVETFTRRFGFPIEQLGDEATARAAVDEWVGLCRDAGWEPEGSVGLTVVRDDPAHTAMGQFVVEVTGERRRGRDGADQ